MSSQPTFTMLREDLSQHSQDSEVYSQNSSIDMNQESSRESEMTRPLKLEDIPPLLGPSMPDLTTLDGVVIRQTTRQGDPLCNGVTSCGCGVTLDPINIYEVKTMPLDIDIGNNFSSWKLNHDKIDNLSNLFTFSEKSDDWMLCYSRILMTAGGCRAMRPLILRTENPHGDYLPLAFDKPLRTGGGVVLNKPHEMTAIARGYEFGSIVEDVSFAKNIERVCCCTTYSKLHTIPPRQFIMDRSFVCYDQKTSKYDIKFDKCRNGNFCGASFCNPRATNVIVNSRTGKATGYIYKIFVSPSSVCCLEKPLDVFVISFPKESTQVERTLLVSAVLFNHFILFEQDREY